MAQTDLLKRYLDAGIAFTQLTQQKAEEIVRDLVRAGEVQTGEAQARVAELVERSRQNTEAMLGKVGLVPKKELEALRKELADLKARKAAPSLAAKAPTKKAPSAAKKPAAKKVPAAKKASAAKAAPTKATKATKASKATKVAKATKIASNLP